MAIQSNFPVVKPSLLLDFANTKQVDPRITFTRTTTATYYDGVTTAMAEQNLILESQALNSSSWSRGSTTVSDNSVAAPNGTTTASTATTSAAGSSLRTIAITVQPSTTYTFSFFALRGTMSDLKYSIYNNTAASDIVAPTSYYASTNASTWSRLSFTFTTPAGCTSIFCFLLRDSIATGTVFLWGAQLEQRSSVTSYTATTTQPITNYIPVLLTAASGVARFQHNPTTDESLGLLIEEARTNLLTYSEDFSNAAWTKVRSSITSNTIVAPDGTLTGDKLVEDTSNNTHIVYQGVSVTSGTAYTLTFYAKSAERTQLFVNLSATGFPASSDVLFDLQNGTSTSSTISHSITSVGNGWYRCSATATANATASANMAIYLYNGGLSYAGNGYSGIYIWGAQLEAGAFPTSYIATTSATVTRNADAASMTGTNFTSWYNQGEGAVYTELSSLSPLTGVQSYALGKYPAVFNFESGTTDTYVSWYGIVAEVYIGNTFNNLGSVPTGANKLAVSFSTTSGQGASSLNGAAAASRSGALTGTATRLGIGSNLDFLSGSCLNGTIKKLAYYPLRLTNAQLQALTS